MKLRTLSFCLITLFFLSCNGGNDLPASTKVTFSLSADSLVFDYVASSGAVQVTVNDEWGVTSNQSWCTCSPSGGLKGTTSVTINTTKNELQTARSALLTFKRLSTTKTLKIIQKPSPGITFANNSLVLSYNSASKDISFTATDAWTVTSDQSWCKLSSASGNAGSATISVTADQNASDASRTATLTFNIGTYSQTYTVLQGCNEGTTNVNISTPDGYVLTWHDEFNTTQPAMPSTTDWWYETGASGWGNNEIENYVAGKTGADTLAYVSDGSLKIKCRKMNGTVYSIRMNTSKSWTYGYFEARLKLPKGKGSWPAFWMLPKNFVSWPLDGEIDIMEEIGAEPNLVSATIHCDAYNSTKNTQKMSRKYVNNAEGSFHVYAMEWTATYIKAYIDGVLYFTFNNDGAGNKSTWPYNVPFYLKLNLAWGGNWGGYLGIDESALPLTYEIDYVRVFQK